MWSSVKYVQNEVGCQMQYFKPFHRAGSEKDLSMTEADKIGRSPFEDGATKTYNIGGQFVQNFDYKNLTISGPAWLTLDSGFLSGVPPRTGATKRHQFKVTATNTVVLLRGLVDFTGLYYPRSTLERSILDLAPH